MTTNKFKIITSSDEIPFLVPEDHLIFQKGIFCEINQDQITPIPAEYWKYIIYQSNIPIEKIPELLRLILPYSIMWLQDKCINKLKKYFTKQRNAKEAFLKSNINMIEIIQNFDNIIDFGIFLQIMNDKISKSYVINKLNHNRISYSKILEYIDFDVSVFEFGDVSILLKNEVLTAHILRNIDLESIGMGNLRPIHYIFQYSTINMIKLIIDLGANLDSEGFLGLRPLHYLCQYSSLEAIKYLIEHGVNVNKKNAAGDNILYYASYHSKIDVVQYFIDSGVDIENGNSRVKPIHRACEARKFGIAKLLIENGANFECKDYSEESPIFDIIRYGNTELIKYMLNKNVNLNVFNSKGKSPIHYSRTNPDLFEILRNYNQKL